MTKNKRETGPRIPKENERPPQTSKNASLPQEPKPYGLTEGLDETEEKTRKSEGVNPGRT